MKKPLTIILSIVVAIIAVLLLNSVESARFGGTTQTVVQLNTTLPPYTKITLSDLKTVSASKTLVPPGVFTSPSQVIGDYATQTMFSGEYIQSSMISTTPLINGLKKGEVALTLPVTNSSLDGLLPGQRATVLAPVPIGVVLDVNGVPSRMVPIITGLRVINLLNTDDEPVLPVTGAPPAGVTEVQVATTPAEADALVDIMTLDGKQPMALGAITFDYNPLITQNTFISGNAKAIELGLLDTSSNTTNG